MALRLGAAGTLVRLSFGWPCGIPHVFAARIQYRKVLFAEVHFLVYGFGTFDTNERLLVFERGTFDTNEQVSIFAFSEAEIDSFLDRILTADGAIDSSRRGGPSGGRCFRRWCGLRKTLFYFRVFDFLYLHVVNSLDF